MSPQPARSDEGAKRAPSAGGERVGAERRDPREDAHRARVRSLAWAAAALGIAVLAPSSGQAFIRLTNDGRGLYHGVQPISYVIHASGSDDVAADSSEHAAIRLAFDTWARVSAANLSFREDTAAASGPKVHANDGVNMILFDEANATGLFTGAGYVIAMTPVFFDAIGRVLDADVVFNGRDHVFGTDLGGTKYDVQNIATHEIGHFIGLDHSGVAGSTLVPFAFPNEVRLCSLSWDDRAGAAAIYPGAGTAPLCSVAGQVLRDSVGRGIDGAHVVAVNAATGEPESSALSSSSGGFTIEMLRPGTYRIYAEPLDGPLADANIQRDGVETGFETSFYGGVSAPAEVTLQPGQRGVQLGQLRLRDQGSALNLAGAGPHQVLRGTTARIDLNGPGLATGLEVEVAGPGVRLSAEPPVNKGVLGPGTSFLCSVDSDAPAGLRDIYVYRGSGAAREMVALPGGFEVIAAAPQVASLTPQDGAAAGGETVTVRGSGFAPGARVLFGDQISPAVTFRSAGEVTATAPPNLVGTVALVVINEDGQRGRLANAFTYVGVPQLDAIAPAEGPSAGGVGVALLGAQFSRSAQVLFDGRAATAVVVSDQGRRLDCKTPAGTSGAAADVTVVNPGGGGGSDTQPDGYRYIDPRIDALDPTLGSRLGGTVVQVLGDGFSPVSRVDFGARQATGVQFVSQNELRATTPAGSVGTVGATVVTSDGKSDVLDNAFRYVDGTDPRITSVSPSRGYTDGGLLVRVFGSAFDRPAVFFGTAPAARIEIVSATEILVTTPAVAQPGAVDVVVRNATGLQAKAFSAFTYDKTTGGAVLAGGRSGGGGGGCRAGGSGDPAVPLLILVAVLGIMRRRARPAPALDSGGTRARRAWVGTPGRNGP